MVVPKDQKKVGLMVVSSAKKMVGQKVQKKDSLMAV